MSNDPIQELRDKKKANNEKIEELGISIQVYLTKATDAQRERVSDTEEYLMYRMLEFEIAGQEEKIKQMREVLKLLKK